MNFVKCTVTDGSTVFVNLDHVESIYRHKDGHTMVWAAVGVDAHWKVKELPEEILNMEGAE